MNTRKPAIFGGFSLERIVGDFILGNHESSLSGALAVLPIYSITAILPIVALEGAAAVFAGQLILTGVSIGKHIVSPSL